MSIQILAISILAGYLLGAISFARVVGAIMAPGEDLTDAQVPAHGTDEHHTIPGISATSIGIALGDRAGCVVGILDMAKVFIPTLAIRLLFPSQPYFLFTAVAGMVGHNWPIYYRFVGGHGYSSIYGSLFAVDWLGALVVPNIGFIIGIFLLKNFLIGYLIGLWLIIPWLWLRTQDWYFVGYGVAMNILFMVAMIPDIKQQRRFEGMRTEKPDIRTSMSGSPMGRGILKMLDRFNIPVK